MKQKGYPKETLTMKNIRGDLRRKLWKRWPVFMFFLLMTVLMVYAIIKEPAILLHLDLRLAIGFVLWPLCIAWTAYELYCLYGGLRLRGRIVKDRLISADSGTDVSVRYYHQTDYCTLHFARFGDYKVPQKNHQWSKLYPLSCMGEYYHASEGDEYYLVLSRPHNGKILLAYNTKMFVLEEEKAENTQKIG